MSSSWVILMKAGKEIAAFDAGADDFIRRPLEPEIVFKRPCPT
ncbi:MAG: hypothetical protein U0X34_02870 [Bacteroidia bacterium]